ncbi:hypothetical protein A9977_14555 [Variovorax sp. UMC13]|nr:hypothetical protein [Variovorax sp. UMC13]
MARGYPGGTDAVALRLGKSASTFEKELRGAPGFKLGAEDAADVSAMCMDVQTENAMAYATAIAVRTGCMLVPLPIGIDVNADECMRAAAETSREAAELIAEVLGSLADGNVSDNELARVDRASGELVAAMQAMRRVMAERNKASKPPVLE